MSDKSYVPDQYRVLVVEDDPDYAKRVMEELQEENIASDHASGADVAVEMLKEKRYHGAVLDNHMNNREGKIDQYAGFDLLHYISKEHEDVTCLMLSKEPTRPSQITVAKDEGMYEYLDKLDGGPRHAARRVTKMLKEERLQYVMARNGRSMPADRMYFYGKTGIVVKTISQGTGENAGIVNIDGEEWQATTRDTEGMRVSGTILPDTKVRAYGIRRGAIQVVSLEEY